jgi:hypothetical protein
MFDFLGERSIFFYVLLGILILGVVQGLGIGGLYFFKRSGERRANFFLGCLIICFSLTLLHNILVITDFFDHNPRFKFLPIYFTLTFPPLLFLHVKLNLYPSYQMRRTDIKHFLLPISQTSYFIFLFFSSVSYKASIDRSFFNPFFGAFEQLLYIVFFFAYLYFSKKYIDRRKAAGKISGGMKKKIVYLEKLIQVLFILFSIHTLFILVDFLSYEFLGVNLRTLKIYAGLGILSYAALLFWVSVYGFQTLIWGRKLFRNKK